MTKSNETSQGDLVRARRRGNLALWISMLSGAASIAVLTVVLLNVYTTEKGYTAREQTVAGLNADIIRLSGIQKTLSDDIGQFRRDKTIAQTEAEDARANTAALSRAAAARDAAVEERNDAKAERRRIEKKRAELADEVAKLRKQRDNFVNEINALTRSRDAAARATEAKLDERQETEATLPPRRTN